MGRMLRNNERELDPFQKEADRLWKVLFNESPPVRKLDEEAFSTLDVLENNENFASIPGLPERGTKDVEK